MKKYVALIALSLMLSGCATSLFPKIGSAPERPSVKSNWKETHKREIDFVSLFAAMKEYEKTGKLPDANIYNETDEFGVGHEDSRPIQKNWFQKVWGWILGLGTIGGILFFVPAATIATGFIMFVKKAFEWRSALWQVVKGVKDAKIADDSEKAKILAASQTKKTEDMVDLIRNKLK